MIVVIDSSIWISALTYGGTPEKALLHASLHDELAVCDYIQDEITRVLADKFQWDPDRIRRRLELYWSDARWIDLVPRTAGVCRDPDDEPILQCAELSKAGCIVTGDKDLLSLHAHNAIPILTARSYLDRALI